MVDEDNLENVCHDCMVERAKSSNASGDTLQKVRVALPKDSGWGSEAEWFWAEKLADGSYALRNVPFYAYGLSYDDEVNARLRGDGVLEFVDVSKRGGHSTYRVIAREGLDDAKVKELLDRIKAVGCDVERANRIHAAIDVEPQTDIYTVCALLESGERAGIWEFEEGHCGHALKGDH